MRVIALRHGQSQFNLRGLCNDDDVRQVALTAAGRRQAEAAARALAAESIAQLYCSPLLRARQTADIVARTCGLAVTPDDRLADIRSGFDGQPVADYLTAIASDPLDTCVNGGESLRDYQGRVEGFLRALPTGVATCIVVVAHEETLRVIDAWANHRSLGDVVGKAFANCTPYAFHVDSAN